jgi:hypothetical protein
LRRRKRSLFELTKTTYALYKHLRACTINEHVFVYLVSLGKKFNPHLRFGKIVHVSIMGMTHTKWDNQFNQVLVGYDARD